MYEETSTCYTTYVFWPALEPVFTRRVVHLPRIQPLAETDQMHTCRPSRCTAWTRTLHTTSATLDTRSAPTAMTGTLARTNLSPDWSISPMAQPRDSPPVRDRTSSLQIGIDTSPWGSSPPFPTSLSDPGVTRALNRRARSARSLRAATGRLHSLNPLPISTRVPRACSFDQKGHCRKKFGHNLLPSDSRLHHAIHRPHHFRPEIYSNSSSGQRSLTPCVSMYRTVLYCTEASPALLFIS
jgi:hypothetical protein